MATNPKAFGNDIMIAVDPGFDATKVCINGISFKIPACVIDITGSLGNYLTKDQDGYILSRYIEGKECLVGEHALALLGEPEVQKIRNQKSGMIESYEKFETEESQINIMTAIGMALIVYEAYSKKNNILPAIDLSQPIDEESPLNIFIGVALPYDIKDSAWNSVKKHIVGKHSFSIETGAVLKTGIKLKKETEDRGEKIEKEVEETISIKAGRHSLNFTILEENAMYNAQSTVAFLGSIMSADGRISRSCLEKLGVPALIIDGGYKTVGDFKFLGTGRTEQATSNTDYAMNNVYEEVAKALNEEYNRPDIKAYNIKNILNQNDGKLVYEKNDNTDIVDIKELVQEKTEKIFEGYIEYLNDKYNKLLDIRQIFVYGGTGAAYFDKLREYVEKHKQHLKGHVTLADYEFAGREIDPVFAVCIGMYKTMQPRLRS